MALGGKPDTPPPPPPPPPPANAPTMANAAAAGADQTAAAMRARGVGSTIMTGGQGLSSPALTTGKQLLGQ